MNPVLLIFAATLAIAQLALPKRYAFLPVLIATYNTGIVPILGEFTVVRILILIGLAQAFASGNITFSLKNPLDKTIFLFVLFAIITLFLADSWEQKYFRRFGLILDVLGTYLYGKAFCTGDDIIKRFAICSLIALAPFTILMLIEQTTGRNYYFPHFGAISEYATFRDGFRAKGVFGHSILAGTTGAVALALYIQFLAHNKRLALLGLAASSTIIYASFSSGPIAAGFISIGFVALWRWKHHVPKAKWAIPLSVILLSIVMERPFYYIIQKFDLTGSSTGWHRARLIEQSIRYFDEWWLAGTDYTRHWMATGVSWSPDHVDMTNYFIHLGVDGGISLTLILFAIYWQGGKILLKLSFRYDAEGNRNKAFSHWCLFACLMAHASSCISISYFDQMYALFYILVALIANLNTQGIADGIHR